MEPDRGLALLRFFERAPQMLPLYERLEAQLLQRLPGTAVQIQKTQIKFSNRYAFAFASLPLRKDRRLPNPCLLVTFGLGYRLEHPRIVYAVEPYPNRWTHHVPVTRSDEIDDELMGWIAEAHAFSLAK